MGFKLSSHHWVFQNYLRFKIIFKIYYELVGKGKHREQICLACEVIQWCLKFPVWELRPKAFHSERRSLLSSGIYIDWDDDDDELFQASKIMLRMKYANTPWFWIEFEFEFTSSVFDADRHGNMALTANWNKTFIFINKKTL